ncbi:Uncharacterized protein GBIM_02511 [Gryllus bimaculatus]|nr:Uncharacterized protein GBIM_02511 [Gryllus bimaculatus]
MERVTNGSAGAGARARGRRRGGGRPRGSRRGCVSSRTKGDVSAGMKRVLVTPQLARRVTRPGGGCTCGRRRRSPPPAAAAGSLRRAGSTALPVVGAVDAGTERLPGAFFLYSARRERRARAQVCSRWRDVLYRQRALLGRLVPVLRCRELRAAPCAERARLYASLLRRGFHAVCLLGATDEDALDLVHSFPQATKHVHSLSLRCSSVSDHGLEALLDHLQFVVSDIVVVRTAKSKVFVRNAEIKKKEKKMNSCAFLSVRMIRGL